ncbi:hypothetical protein BCR34DRAFT_642375 [Clohesyomyces aquaticus]|uniref:Uncharacterized protein n=1 Tax=Clohesyomyces aquaticus TaxID=1231657 RepID=A0A1Y1ZZI4_9PLEO|nr:hypothetical protein BCR34DRAFT_642375 [Clohesyomyces aquaticus]
MAPRPRSVSPTVQARRLLEARRDKRDTDEFEAVEQSNTRGRSSSVYPTTRPIDSTELQKTEIQESHQDDSSETLMDSNEGKESDNPAPESRLPRPPRIIGRRFPHESSIPPPPPAPKSSMHQNRPIQPPRSNMDILSNCIRIVQNNVAEMRAHISGDDQAREEEIRGRNDEITRRQAEMGRRMLELAQRALRGVAVDTEAEQKEAKEDRRADEELERSQEELEKAERELGREQGRAWMRRALEMAQEMEQEVADAEDEVRNSSIRRVSKPQPPHPRPGLRGGGKEAPRKSDSPKEMPERMSKLSRADGRLENFGRYLQRLLAHQMIDNLNHILGLPVRAKGAVPRSQKEAVLERRRIVKKIASQLDSETLDRFGKKFAIVDGLENPIDSGVEANNDNESGGESGIEENSVKENSLHERHATESGKPILPRHRHTELNSPQIPRPLGPNIAAPRAPQPEYFALRPGPGPQLGLFTVPKPSTQNRRNNLPKVAAPMLPNHLLKEGPGPKLGFFAVPKVKPQNIRGTTPPESNTIPSIELPQTYPKVKPRNLPATTPSETGIILSPQTELLFPQKQGDASAKSPITQHMMSSKFASLPIKPAREDYELAVSLISTVSQPYNRDPSTQIGSFPTSDMRSTANKGLGGAPPPSVIEIDHQDISERDVPMASIEYDIEDAKSPASRPRAAGSPIDSVLLEDSELGGFPDQMEDVVLSDIRTRVSQDQADSTSGGEEVTSGTSEPEPEHWPVLWHGDETEKPYPMLERFENGHAFIKVYDKYEGMLLSEDWVDAIPKEGVDWEAYFAKALRELDELDDEWWFK